MIENEALDLPVGQSLKRNLITTLMFCKGDVQNTAILKHIDYCIGALNRTQEQELADLIHDKTCNSCKNAFGDCGYHSSGWDMVTFTKELYLKKAQAMIAAFGEDKSFDLTNRL